MGFKHWVVYRQENGGFIEANDIIDVRVTLNSQAKSNIAELTINNYRNHLTNEGELAYNVDDILKIYAAEGIVDISNPEHLIMTAYIKNIDFTPVAKTIKIKCGDKTYDMLNQVYQNDHQAESLPVVIKEVIDTIVNDGSEQFYNNYDIAQTKSDGQVFPFVNYASANKTAYEVIAELSQPEYTGEDREYIFWFDENEKFHWQYPSSDIRSTLLFGQEPVIEMTGGRQESDTISSIIYNAGNDLNEVSIVGLYHDPTATSTNVIYQPMTDIAKALKRANFTTDNEVFLAEAERQAKARSSRIVMNVGTGLWAYNLTVRGFKYVIGEKYIVGDLFNEYPAQRLRINKIIHIFSRQGWQTKLSMEQDPKDNQ